MQMARGAVGVIEVVGDHADLLAFGDPASAQQSVGIHRGRRHVHVAKADVFGRGIDLQHRRLLLRRTDHDAIANREHRLLLGIAMVLGAGRGAGAGAYVLALMAEAAGALTDLKAAGLAKIVAPGIAGRLELAALAERLRAHEGRGFLDRESDLRIGGEIDTPAEAVTAAI